MKRRWLLFRLALKVAGRRAAGVNVELDVTDGAIHVFQVFAPFVPGAAEAIERIGEFVDRKLALRQ